MKAGFYWGIVTGICILFLVVAGCTDTGANHPETTVSPTTVPTTAPTPTPEKEIVYVYVTVTVTPTSPTPVPTPTKDTRAISDLPSFNAWRYNYTSKTDGVFYHGAVTALLLHLEKAPDEAGYELYYESGRRWREDLETLIDNAESTVPSFQSKGMRSADANYTAILDLKNGTIRTLDRVLTN